MDLRKWANGFLPGPRRLRAPTPPQRLLRAAKEDDQRTVRISTPDGFGSLFLTPRMRVLTHRHPKLEIEILVTARQFSLLKRETDIAIGLSRPEHMRVVSRRLTDYRMYVYGSLAYLEKATPIVTMQDLKNDPFIGYVEELLFAPELNFAEAIGADIEPRIRSTSVLAQLHATLSGGGLCVLAAFVASSYPTLVPILPEKVSVTLSYHMHIHEAAHVREVAAFIAAEVERDHSLFCPNSDLAPCSPSPAAH
jgi:DNA-binding transcriptional LysR family regulator